MIEGKIIKGIAGFYYVKTDQDVYECKARGKFRNENISPLIGDQVLITIEEQVSSNGFQVGNIEEILLRKNQLIRPTVSNVDQAVIVFASSNPAPNLDLLDRFLILVEEQHLDVCICINKIDIDEEKQYQKIEKVYSAIGYTVIATSAISGQGIDRLRECLQNKTTVFAGPSGVGKSTLLNAVQPSLKLKTGQISKKVKRGKHTTRHAELLGLDTGGFVVDTPGFSSLMLNHISKDQLQYYFPEFEPYIQSCKFTGCSHIHEPNCVVKEKVEEEVINKNRYERYIKLYEQLEDKRRW
jgi:ribosome biogenesis GTPase